MKILNDEQLEQAAFAMQIRGGSFISRIGEAYTLADPKNREKLTGAFTDAFTEYYSVYCRKAEEVTG